MSSGAERRRHAVLTAPLWMPSADWSSRSIAERLGVSQSSVSRTWRDGGADDGGAVELRDRLSLRPLALAGALVSARGSWLLLAPASLPAHRPPAPLGERSRRRLRVLRAADAARADLDLRAAADAATERFRGLVERLGAGSESALVIASGPRLLPAGDVDRELVIAGWGRLPELLAGLDEAGCADALADLESRARRWYRTREGAFLWTRQAPPPAEAGAAPIGSAVARSAAERRLADAIVHALRSGMIDGTFTRGDALSERALADRLHCSRARVRAALVMLADEGLVTASSAQSMVVRLPTTSDVVETYAARRALGAIALRATSTWSAGSRAAVHSALADLRERVTQGDVDRAQDLDLRFQRVLAEASGLTRIPAMLEVLSQQVTMFIAVLGVDYAFPAARILEQDTAMVDALERRDTERAIALWRLKMDEGLDYMIGQLDSVRGSRSAPAPAPRSHGGS
ncbi:GntR family transcriptional regulator [Rathayibacter sp. VKM Ac-2759]|uniref:GntR family transcriptional regulator n=1 Tax=Rathayibacter sp. VKM Ac-2759 TaxID=2609252 RepID=UPI00131809EB|nr:GntR family transcriptional regulator [Rathayibacter sp. VKM Ac-2759]QHC68042.1 GntR family transcriptional regulator [Rathayibacter sp. VKM Ac-2759]